MSEIDTTQLEVQDLPEAQQNSIASSVGATAITPELLIKGFDTLRTKETSQKLTALMLKND